MTEPIVVVIQDNPAPVTLVTGLQGPPGPPGPLSIPDPTNLADGRMLAVLDGEFVDIPPPSGTGDMQSLIYDPQGVAANVYNLANLSGNLDGGTFN